MEDAKCDVLYGGYKHPAGTHQPGLGRFTKMCRLTRNNSGSITNRPQLGLNVLFYSRPPKYYNEPHYIIRLYGNASSISGDRRPAQTAGSAAA